MTGRWLPVDTIYTDFAHAVDSAVQSKLIFKLTNYSVSGNFPTWIYAFLSFRKQCVVTELCYSRWQPVL